MQMFSRLKSGLSKTRTQIAAIVGIGTGFDEQFYSSLEEALVAADIGLDRSLDIIERLKAEIAGQVLTTRQQAYQTLKDMLVLDLEVAKPPAASETRPLVVLVVGVNGVGKTTTVGKLAHAYRGQGKSVLLGACDTFRAGAIEQLKIWAERTGSLFVGQQAGADSASVGFDAMEAAIRRESDVVILDTAGRLHNKVNLMNELEKVLRVIRRHTADAPHEIFLVLDATTGQNALTQARVFNELLGLTGLVVTKLDGTAKGGIAFALVKELGVPIRKIGVGEGMDDLQDFNARDYVEAMFGELQ